MDSELLTTGQAAKLCSVTPDTVLKWIRSGRLPAHRTPGGHHRIDRHDLDRLVNAEPRNGIAIHGEPGAVRYCWEFNSNGHLLDACRDCIVYAMRAHRCYEVIKLVQEGHGEQFCQGTCDDCGYFKQVHQQSTNILVVTDNETLAKSLKEDSKEAPFSLEVTHCEYTASAIVQDFRPDYAVIDCSLGEQQARDISHHLVADPRIPFVKVIMATSDGKLPEGCDKQIFAHVRKPLRTNDIAQIVDGSREIETIETIKIAAEVG